MRRYGRAFTAWQVAGAVVTMTQSGYWPRQSHAHGTVDRSMSSTAGDFRNLTPLVLMSALQRAGTQVYEPMHRFRLEVPADTAGSVLPALARLRAVPQETAMRGSACILAGEIPAARVHDLRQQLPTLTRGEGTVDCAFDRYQPARGTPPRAPVTEDGDSADVDVDALRPVQVEVEVPESTGGDGPPAQP